MNYIVKQTIMVVDKSLLCFKKFQHHFSCIPAEILKEFKRSVRYLNIIHSLKLNILKDFSLHSKGVTSDIVF